MPRGRVRIGLFYFESIVGRESELGDESLVGEKNVNILLGTSSFEFASETLYFAGSDASTIGVRRTPPSGKR